MPKATTATGDGNVAVEGSFTFTGSDGKQHNVSYVADNDGFKAQGDLIEGVLQ